MQSVARLAQSVEHQTFKADITQISEGRRFESHVGRSVLRNEPDGLGKLTPVDFDAQALVKNYFSLQYTLWKDNVQSIPISVREAVSASGNAAVSIEHDYFY